MNVLVTSKNKEYRNKNEGARVATTLNIDFSQSRADKSAVKGRIWLKFEHIRDVMTILVTLMNEEDPIKIKGARVATTQSNDFSNTHARAANSTVKFEPIRDIIVVLVTCKNEEDPLKNNGARVATTFFPL